MSLMMKIACLSLMQTAIVVADLPSKPNSDAALEMLLTGNQRFVSGKVIHKNLGQEGLAELKKGQEPFAIVIGCSDSRVPPEIVFDQGLGDIFVVRDAGNVIGPIELDSIEFAILKLHVPLVIVLGHENCGAVQAALTGQSNVPELKNIYPLIAPALQKCSTAKGDTLMNAVKCNVREGVLFLKARPELASLVEQKKLTLRGG